MGDSSPVQRRLLRVALAPVSDDGKDAGRAPSDEEIVKALNRGEGWAAETLYKNLYPAVSRTLWRVFQTRPNDFEDLVQITFERVIRTLVDNRYAGACSLTTWASSIASHVALDTLRAKTRERKVFSSDATIALDDRTPHAADPERSLEARSEVRQLQGILGRMKRDQARAILLHDVLGHELAEVAAVMGVSIAAAQSRLVRGRKELVRRKRASIVRRNP